MSEVYHQAAAEVGRRIAERGDRLVYGGTDVGLMGVLATNALRHGGEVTGIIPDKLEERGIGKAGLQEKVQTRDLRDRKGEMDRRSDAFLALPGGLGTLEEALEVLNLKYLRYHQKPVIFLNLGGFYDGLEAFFEVLYRERFTKPAVRRLYHMASGVDDIFDYLDRYEPVEIDEKWYIR